MSAKIAPENISVGVSLASRAAPRPFPTSRPIEDAGALAADSNSSKNKAFGRKISDGDKAEPGTRPPGKDPSVLPQSLFDAALIASEFKPQTLPVETPPSTIDEQAATRTAEARYAAEKSEAAQEYPDQENLDQSLDGRTPLTDNESVARLSQSI